MTFAPPPAFLFGSFSFHKENEQTQKKAALLIHSNDRFFVSLLSVSFGSFLLKEKNRRPYPFSTNTRISPSTAMCSG